MEDGVNVAQFDPATGNIKIYDIGLRDANGVARYGDPHGVSFDFNTHLSPRVWFVYRNENLDLDLPLFVPRDDQLNGHGPGTVGYLDVRTETLWTAELNSNSISNQSGPQSQELNSTHAVFVDTRGHVWATSDNAIIEIDTSLDSNGRSTGSLDSHSGSIIMHNLPEKLGDTGNQAIAFRPHGLQVIVDNRTGTPYVLMSDGDANNGSARVVLLQPGKAGTLDDQWKEWNFNDLLTAEGNTKTPPTGATLFLSVDDNETPGKPEDDRLIAASPGALQRGAGGIMRVLDLSTILGPLVAADLARFNGKTVPPISLPTTAPVTSYRLPSIPGSTQTFASNQVPFVDRGGNVFFVDALGGVGRFNINDPNTDFVTDLLKPKTNVQLSDFSSKPSKGDLSFSSTRVKLVPLEFAAKPVIESPVKADRSPTTGIDHYEVAMGVTAAQGGLSGRGLFRGTLDAENTLYGSISSSDYVASTIFAESNRRQLAVLASPFPLPTSARVGGRVALQVLRDGSVVLTGRGDGELRDIQVNLTKLKSGNSASLFDDLAVIGEIAALTNESGVIEALGRQADGRLIRYTFNPPTKSWKTEDLKNPLFWTANIKLAIPNGQVAAEDPIPAPGIGFTITTTDGHLIVVPSGGDPVDLSASARLPADYAVYAGVGGVVAGTRFRFYGGNQTGSIVEYSTDRRLGDIRTQTLVVPNTDSVRPAGDSDRDIRILRNIQPLVDGATIHLFATDGVARLIHYQLDSNGKVMLAENVTQLVQKTGQVFGYFDFQKAYGGRVYTYVSATKDNDGNIRVYGTNGGDLIEFTLDTAGKWRVGNLTNDIKSTDGVKNDSRIPANFVFGAPSVYRDTTGERHVLQINAEGEIVEYYTLANDPQKRFHTQNVNLRIGDDSKIENLRFRSSSVESTASVQSIPIISSSVSSGSTASLFAAPYVSSLDVNADGVLSPLDVLLIINYLNTPAETSKPGDGESSDFRLDVNGDGWISPLDVLMLVNHLNSGNASAGGEGESEVEANRSEYQFIEAAALDLAFADLDQWDSFQSSAKKRRAMQPTSK